MSGSTRFSNSDIFIFDSLILLHSEKPKLYTILAFLSVVGLRDKSANFICYVGK